MADESKPAFYPRVGRTIAKNARTAPRSPLQNDPRAMELPSFGDVDLSVPSPLNRDLSQRIAQRDASLRAQADADMSPLEKAAAALQTIGFLGSAVKQSIGSLPTLAVKGPEAAEQFIQENIYKPTQPKAYEYAGDVADFLEGLETQYKLPPIMPEATALQYLVGPAISQAKNAGIRQGMKFEKAMEPKIMGALERGGLGREAILGMAQGTGANVIKRERGNWLGGNPERATAQLKSPKIAGETPAQRIPRHEQLLQDPTLSDESRASVERLLNAERQRDALDKWVDRNLTNYVKEKMASPSDTIRLTLDSRRDEIEAKFAKDQQRAQKMADRANAETDPRKKANLMRQSQQMMADASFEKDLAISNMFPIGESLRNYKPDVGTVNQRVSAGFPEQGMARNPEASAWESLVDEYIFPTKVKDYLETKEGFEKYSEAKDRFEKALHDARDRMTEKWIDSGLSPKQAAAATSKMDMFDLDSSLGDTNLKDLSNEMNKYASNTNLIRAQQLKDNPWIEKLNPEEQIYKTSSGSIMNMNFDHVLDVLREDMTAGRLSPEQLNKVSIDQAIRRTQEYDTELARKMIQAKMASREGLPLYKEYPEGYKWYELNRPGDFASESQSMGHSVRGYEPPQGHPDWVEGSGEMGSLGYGHGGWEGIKSGRAKVYSLVDPKGEPHATVEVKQGRDKTGLITSEELPPEVLADIKKRNVYDPNFMWRFDEELGRHVPEIGPFEPTITQIKGKQNRAPNEEYLPYVQDLVQSGNWSDVRDLQNTGLRDITKTPKVYEYLKQKGVETPRYIPEKKYLEYEDDFLMDQLYPPDAGMKAGGVVISDNPDRMMMQVEDQGFAGGGAMSKAALEAIAKFKSLRGEFVDKAAEQAKYLRDTKHINSSDMPSFEEWKAMQINVTPQNIEQLKKETGNKNGGLIKVKRKAKA